MGNGEDGCGDSDTMCPLHTLLSGVWNLISSIECQAGTDAGEDIPIIMWESLTPTEKLSFEVAYRTQLQVMAQHVSTITQIHQEHLERR